MQYLGISESLFMTLLASLGGALVVMYLFRLRRRRVQVPYSPLWQKVLEERPAQSIWRRLRRLFSLLLHLLILASLLLALRDPRPRDQVIEGRHVLLMVDTSASMSALDEEGGRDRMEAARERALEVFTSLGPDDRLMIVRMDAQVQPLTPFVRPTPAMAELLRELDYTATAANLVDALAFAARSLEGKERPELFLVSDAAFSDESWQAAANLDLPRDTTLHLLRVGRAQGNLAITNFNVRRYPANRLNYEVFVQVSNGFEVDLSVRLILSANRRPIHQTLLEIEAGQSVEQIYTNLATGGRRIEARVELVDDQVEDLFPLDDVAYALLPEERATRVLLVTEGNLWLEAPFLLNQSVELSIVRPDFYAPTNGHDPSAAYDVTLFDQIAPPIAERGAFLFVRPAGPHSPWSVRGVIDDPIIDRFERTDPLMRWIHNLRSVNINRAQELRLGAGDVAAARAIGGAPIFIRRDEPQRRMVGMAFAIQDSDFALRLAYPLFMLNAVDWLTRDFGTLIDSYTTGLAYRVFLDGAQGEAAVLTSPRGTSEEIPIHEGYVTLYPEQPGFYELSWDALRPNHDNGHQEAERQGSSHQADGARAELVQSSLLVEPRREGFEGAIETRRTLLAVNFSHHEESLIGAPEELPEAFSRDWIAPEEGPLTRHYDPWFYLVLGALFLVSVEWLTYQRRITV